LYTFDQNNNEAELSPIVEVFRKDPETQGQTSIESRAVIKLPGIKPEMVSKALLETELRKSWDFAISQY
jgi:hypothetical protein